jgi:hypothetical protein
MSKIHHVKSWPQYFKPIEAGLRTHELRRNDRDYNVGDLMVLEEFDPAMKKYAGNVLEVEITAMTSMNQPCAVSSEALDPEFCIPSIRPIIREADRIVKSASAKST